MAVLQIQQLSSSVVKKSALVNAKENATVQNDCVFKKCDKRKVLEPIFKNEIMSSPLSF